MTTLPFASVSGIQLDTGHLREPRNACSTCSLRELCLPSGLQLGEINAVDKLINRQRHVARGEHLFRNDAPLPMLYAIRMPTAAATDSAAAVLSRLAGVRFDYAGAVYVLDAQGRLDSLVPITALAALAQPLPPPAKRKT